MDDRWTSVGGRTPALAALLVAPALLTAGWLALPTPEGSAAEQLADVEASLGRWTTAWLLLLAGALLAPLAAAALIALAGGPGTTMVRVGWFLSGLGAMGFVGLAAVRGLHGAQLAGDVGDDPALDPGLASGWDELQSGLLRPFVYMPEVLAAGLVLLGIAVSRRAPTRMAGRVIAVGGLVIVGGLFVSQTVVAGIGAAVLLVGCADAARRAGA